MDKNYLTIETWDETWYVFPWSYYAYCFCVPTENYTSNMYDEYVNMFYPILHL